MSEPGAVGLRRYPGPPPFQDTPEDQRIFFGRIEEIETLSNLIIAAPLVVVFGKSGLGKTSLLQAGAFPRLRDEGFLPVRVRLERYVSVLKLVTDATSDASSRLGVVHTPGESGTLWDFLGTSLFWRGDTLMTPVLIFDQFEEIFTLADASERAAFAAAIGPLVSGVAPVEVRGPRARITPKVKIVLSLREEYLASLHALSPEIPRLFQDHFRVLPLTEQQAAEAIRKPAAVSADFSTPPFEYAPEALAAILEFLKGRTDTVEPFQLQLLCQHIEAVIAKTGRRIVQVEDLGGNDAMASVLQRFYTNTLNQFPHRRRSRVAELCETGLLNRDGHRLSVEEEHIQNEFRVDRATLSRLVDVRLLRKEPRLESVFYELSHDTLAQSILRIRRWRIPKRYRPAAFVGTFALAVLVVSAIFYLQRLANARDSADQARQKAEELVTFLIGEDHMEQVRLVGRMELMNQVQNEVWKQLAALSPQNQGLAHLNAGHLFKDRLEFSSAGREYAVARQIFKDLAAAHPDNTEWSREFAMATARLAGVAAAQFHIAESVELHKQAVTILEDLKARAGPPGNRVLRDLTDTYQDLGLSLMKQGRVHEAVAYFDKSLGIAETALKSQANSIEWLHLLMDAHDGRGYVLGVRGDLRGPEQEYRKAYEYAREAMKNSPYSPRAQYRTGLALSRIVGLTVGDRPADAISQYEDIRERFRALTRWDPENRLWQLEIANVGVLLAQAHANAGEDRKAVKEYEDAHTLMEELNRQIAGNGTVDEDLSAVEQGLAAAKQKNAKYNDAVAHYDRALALLEPLRRIDPTNISMDETVARVHLDKAEALRSAGDYASAGNSSRTALQLLLSAKSPDPSNTGFRAEIARAHRVMGAIYSYQGKAVKAAGEYQAAEQVMKPGPGPDDATYYSLDWFGASQLDRGRELLKTGSEAAANEAFRKAIESFRQMVRLNPDDPADHKRLINVYLYDLAPLQAKRDKASALRAYNEALAATEDAARLRPKKAGDHQEYLASVFREIGEGLLKLGVDSDASRAFNGARRHLELAVNTEPGRSFYRSELVTLLRSDISPLCARRGDKAGQAEAEREANIQEQGRQGR